MKKYAKKYAEKYVGKYREKYAGKYVEKYVYKYLHRGKVTLAQKKECVKILKKVKKFQESYCFCFFFFEELSVIQDFPGGK